METILDATLQALEFHYSPLGYPEKRALQCFDITNKPELAIELEDNSQQIVDFEDEKTRKKLEHAAKRKIRRDNLGTLMPQALATGFAAPLLSRSPLPTL